MSDPLIFCMLIVKLFYILGAVGAGWALYILGKVFVLTLHDIYVEWREEERDRRRKIVAENDNYFRDIIVEFADTPLGSLGSLQPAYYVAGHRAQTRGWGF